MRILDARDKKEWDEFMASEEKRFDEEVALAKASSVPYNVEDGQMRERFENHESTN